MHILKLSSEGVVSYCSETLMYICINIDRTFKSDTILHHVALLGKHTIKSVQLKLKLGNLVRLGLLLYG